MAFKSLADNSKSLQLYLRYEAAITREYDRALKQLLTLRSKFPMPAEAELPNEPTAASNVATECETKPPSHEPRATSHGMPNEPTVPEKCCGFNTQGVCGLGRKCPDAHLYKKVA